MVAVPDTGVEKRLSRSFLRSGKIGSMGYFTSSRSDTGRNPRLLPAPIANLGGDRKPHVRVRLPVGVVLGSSECGALAKDLGLEGAFIETFDEPDVGDLAEVVVRHPIVDRELRLPAVVRWVTANGFGVEFVRLDDRARRAVEALARTFW
jgi:hypothetical protein